ncbi:sensor histidine kinase NtrY-like [Methylobrevis albus]|uniref:histidine kinase n=1 Tax=Methylobrevis albus TaxID=2793297 RepID=A0A931I0I7_9HYPH|nr:PAS domain-containing sensor histidine kinase [Methylobrevis albus]MBH0237016.1 PAS domain-containing sensor histidine kinase [Methylobrevis albus]
MTIVDETGRLPAARLDNGRGDGRLRRRLGLAAVVLAFISSVATFVLLAGLAPIEPNPRMVQISLGINAVLVIAVLVAIGVEVSKLWRAWREGRAGARLHLRIVALFSLIAALPAALVAGAFAVTLNQGFDRWFETRTRQIVDNVLTVASAYMQEHAGVLRGDLIGIATAVDAAKPLYDFEPSRFEQGFEAQSSLRGVQGAFLLDADGNIILRNQLQPDTEVIMPPARAMAEAAKGSPVLISPGASNQVGGVLKLKAYEDTYLYVVRSLDAVVLDNLRLARESAVEYRQLEASRSDVQTVFGLVFAGLTLIMLLGAIWLGLAFSTGLVAPIRRLIGAAGEVAGGNLLVEVPVGDRNDDLGSLGETFNKMTSQLRSQRDDLLQITDQADRRRRFTEAVLSGVTAAVVGVTSEGRISIANRSATDLIGLDEADLIGRRLIDEVPGAEPLLSAAMRDDSRIFQGTFTFVRPGMERVVSARVASDRSPDSAHGYVVTLDDISDLISAQRTSAWADVARRIAHEIKNPLTPIQLSAERIRRRYGKLIDPDDPVFNRCVDTIIRQVGDIGRMVDEFSGFARMPKPSMDRHDLADSIRESVFLLGVGRPEIDFETDLPAEPLAGLFDNRLMSQAITNLVKNAAEAIDQVPVEERDGGKGHVLVAARRQDDQFVIEVVDDGIGLPKADRHRLLEPYMTTREKGTGLGLAIVRKIIEEHGGRVELNDAPAVATGGRGAMVRVTFPVTGAA